MHSREYATLLLQIGKALEAVCAAAAARFPKA